MAGIIHRFGNADEFDPYKLRAAEFALVIIGNEIYPSNSLYFCYNPGNVKMVATFDDMVKNIDKALETVTEEFLASINKATADAQAATQEANTVAQLAEDKALLADEAKDRANTAAANAEAIVLGDIATDTTVGVVKSGGDVTVEVDGTMSVSEASNANVTVVESAEDGEITTGLLSAIIGLIKKKLANKIDKTSIAQTVEISDATKVPSSVVTAWLASQISSLVNSLTAINNNLTLYSKTVENSITLNASSANSQSTTLSLPSGAIIVSAYVIITQNADWVTLNINDITTTNVKVWCRSHYTTGALGCTYKVIIQYKISI